MKSVFLVALLAAHVGAQVSPIPFSGCPNAGVCSWNGSPQINFPICFGPAFTCVPPSVPFVIFGSQLVVGVPILPPLACSPTGAPCILACNPIASWGLQTVCFHIPNNLALVGQCFCIQAGCVNPTGLGFCLDFCQALRVCIMP
jgi:hypothetical protein